MMGHLFTGRMVFLLILSAGIGLLLPELERLCERHPLFSRLRWLMLAGYGVIYLYLTLFSRSEIGVPYATGVELRPLAAVRRAILRGSVGPLRGIILNVLLFLPMGYLLPFTFRKLRRIWRIVLLALAISLLTEVLQLSFAVGWFDVDDIINNTIGALLGAIIWRIRWRVNENESGA
jgi:glycopeptide antibiotics resistance protein